MNELWRKLQIGDRIRIVRMPDWSSTPDSSLDETVALYHLLVEEGAILTIREIDEYEIPWTAFFSVVPNGDGRYQILLLTDATEEGSGAVYHTLAIDDDSWECVETE